MSSHQRSHRHGHRQARLERTVAELLSYDLLPSLSDPLLEGLRVVHVELKGLSCIHAVLAPIAQCDDTPEEVKKALAHAEGWLRTELASRLRIKHMPALRLEYIPVVLPEMPDSDCAREDHP